MELFLTGKYEYQMDSKGRVIIPPEFRKAFLVNGVAEVYLLNVNGRIQLLPKKAYERLMGEVHAQSILDGDTMNAKSVLGSSIAKGEIKPDGRITIPPLFRKDNDLKKRVYVVGALDCVEIWDAERWIEKFEKSGITVGTLLQKVHDKKYRRDVNISQKND